jgi:hypothetical protein
MFFDSVNENFDFQMVGDIIYRGRTAIPEPLTGRNRRGKRRCLDGDYFVGSEVVKDE